MEDIDNILLKLYLNGYSEFFGKLVTIYCCQSDYAGTDKMYTMKIHGLPIHPMYYKWGVPISISKFHIKPVYYIGNINFDMLKLILVDLLKTDNLAAFS